MRLKMKLISTFVHLFVLFFVMIHMYCAEQKNVDQHCFHAHEKKFLNSIQPPYHRLIVPDYLIDPHREVLSRQKADLEEKCADCHLDTIRSEKERLRNRVNTILDSTPSKEVLLYYCPHVEDNPIQARALNIARAIVWKKNNNSPKKNETDKQFTARLLEAELKRFIIPEHGQNISATMF